MRRVDALRPTGPFAKHTAVGGTRGNVTDLKL